METLELNPKHFRPGTNSYHREVNFFFDDGGMGDYICWMSAILFVAKECPHVKGHLYVPPYFKSLAENFLKPYPHWTLGIPGETFNAALPEYRPHRRPINATGSNLLDLGFMYFAECNPAPKETTYPVLDLSGVHISGNMGAAQFAPYIVITVGASFENRMLRPEAFNELKTHVMGKGFIPVILGKSAMGRDDERRITIHSGYNFEGCINLINETTELEAAKIISYAEMIVGLDNGLLHLAACTDTPIIFGYTTASPEHREPRPKAKQFIINVHPNVEKLSCTFCQSQMRFLFNHNFSKCAYNDFLCTKSLTGAVWTTAVDQMLGLISCK